MSVMRCPHCGTANRAGSNFCNSCGVNLRALEDEQAGLDAQLPESPIRAAAADTTPEPGPPVSPGTQEPSDTKGAPWVRLDFASEADAPPFDEEESQPPADVERLLNGLPGLLVPVRITVSVEVPEHRSSPPAAETTESQAELWRSVRTHMATPPLLAGFSLPGSHTRVPDAQLRWLFLVLALAVTVPVFSIFAWPSGSASEWPGVREAFDVINSLPPNADVLVYWAYDPAMAGELDLEALPVTTHLLQRRARLTVVSLLPGGPATARRLVNQARQEWQRTERLTVAAKSTWTIPFVYLPGGAAILAFVGQAPEAALNQTELPETLADATLDEPPDLSIVLAAQADDVQHWLEQVQPLNQSPVVAVVAAAADPVVRPYLDSGQLVGLVSGFDGAYSYRRMLDELSRNNSVRQLDMQLVLQDWGQFVFFLLIVVGNFISVLRRGDRTRAQR